MINEYVAVGGVKTGKENWGVERKPTPMPLCLPQMPGNLTFGRRKLATNCLTYGTADVIVTVKLWITRNYI
jgi:hypothetical protein